MRRTILASVFFISCVTMLCAQGVDLSQAKMVVQFSRAMKAERAKNTIDFNVSAERDYVVDMQSTGFKPNFKVVRADGQTIATGKKVADSHVQVQLVGVPAGSLQVIVGGDEVYSRGTYKITVYELPKRK